MKVLHVLNSIRMGGGTTVALKLTQFLQAQSGVHCEIATTDGFPCCLPLTDSTTLSKVPVYCFPARFPSRWWHYYSPALSRFLYAELGRFDLVHLHGMWDHSSYVAYRAAQRHNIPYVMSIHGALAQLAWRKALIRKCLYMSTLGKLIIRSAAAIHCLTDKEREQVTRWGIETPTFIIPNGISPDLPDAFINTDPSKFLARYPGLASKRIILFMGRLHVQKGLEVLASSFSRIAARFHDAVLLIVGPDTGDNSKEKMIVKLKAAGIQDRVIFTGPLSGYDWQAAYVCAEIFVLFSRWEGFGLVLLEAMAAGLPIVASEHCEVKFTKSDMCLSFPLKDELLAEGMATLLSDKQRASNIGQNGRRLVVNNYTWPAIAKSMATHYSKIIEQHLMKEPH